MATESETITDAHPAAQNPIESVPQPQHGLTANQDSPGHIPLNASPAVRQAERLGSIDVANRRHIELDAARCNANPAPPTKCALRSGDVRNRRLPVGSARRSHDARARTRAALAHRARPLPGGATRHLKRRAAADNRRLSLLGIGVADAGNARGAEHNPPAVLAGYGCGEHAEGERRRDDEVATGRFRRPQHVGECVDDDGSGSCPTAVTRPGRRRQAWLRYAETGHRPGAKARHAQASSRSGGPLPFFTTVTAVIVRTIA